ncbi:MAG: CPBP family intramembrane metalloprotease [Butyrivibrio sp.]|nr:CPBP family intramembrane metalloprotease [Butyrivibrio sp.]
MNIKWYEYILWALIGAVSALVLTFIFNVTHLTEMASYQGPFQALFYRSDSLPVLITLYCFATPLAEEIIFRYYIFNTLMHSAALYNHPKKAAVSILITAALFGIYHLNFVQMLYGFIMGLLITYSYYKRNVLTVPFLVHSAANAVALYYTFM